MEWLKVLDRDGLDATECNLPSIGRDSNAFGRDSNAFAKVSWSRAQLWKMTCLNGTFETRLARWKGMKGALDMEGRTVWLIGCGA